MAKRHGEEEGQKGSRTGRWKRLYRRGLGRVWGVDA